MLCAALDHTSSRLPACPPTQRLAACCPHHTPPQVYLILTLNHIYPDYDFSLLRAHHFRKEGGVAAVEELVDAHLVEASKVGCWAVPGCRCCVPSGWWALERRGEEPWKAGHQAAQHQVVCGRRAAQLLVHLRSCPCAGLQHMHAALPQPRH